MTVGYAGVGDGGALSRVLGAGGRRSGEGRSWRGRALVAIADLRLRGVRGWRKGIEGIAGGRGRSCDRSGGIRRIGGGG